LTTNHNHITFVKLQTHFSIHYDLNQRAGAHGIGRDDIVENRFVGMKSRGSYETPAGTVMLKAHRAMESLTLDREAAHLKDELMPKYANMVYNGFWFAPEREMLILNNIITTDTVCTCALI
jgi:argininosuccinate synthase